MSEDPKDFRVEPMTRFSVVPPKGAGTALGHIEKFKADADLDAGLCPSCLNSGFVHERRDGLLGVVADHSGKLLRCECPRGLKVDRG